MNKRRRLKYYLLKLIRLKDSPKAVAGGLAWGGFVHFYPVFGVGPLLAVTMAKLSRVNMAAATVGWVVFMPLFPFFFYLNYLIGNLFVRVPAEDLKIVMQSFINFRLEDYLLVGKAFIIGSLLNSLVELVLIWTAGSFFLKRYRKRTQEFIRDTL
jgi:uncharacterized protein (DUF2062 family)